MIIPKIDLKNTSLAFFAIWLFGWYFLFQLFCPLKTLVKWLLQFNFILYRSSQVLELTNKLKLTTNVQMRTRSQPLDGCTMYFVSFHDRFPFIIHTIIPIICDFIVSNLINVSFFPVISTDLSIVFMTWILYICSNDS